MVGDPLIADKVLLMVGARKKRAKYWCKAMKRRMCFSDEIARLESVMWGFYARAKKANDPDAQHGIRAWVKSKRPYGNKDIAESIAFNLGWDWKRVLRTTPMPIVVRNAADELHAYIINKYC